MPSDLPLYHGFTETAFVGLYFCLFERPKGLLLGVSTLSTGLPDSCPLEDDPAVARALAGFRTGEGLSKLTVQKALPSPDSSKKWKVKSYQVNEYADLVVSQVTTAKGKLVGWFVAAPCTDSEGWTYVALHEPKHFPAVFGRSSCEDEDESLQAAMEWAHVCQFRGKI